ncbi:MAG TPA: chemotaxis protein CheB [Pirellulaceae bacterium]|nr:chemotaxis protein CheB [Pirellulaceae bacterium]
MPKKKTTQRKADNTKSTDSNTPAPSSTDGAEKSKTVRKRPALKNTSLTRLPAETESVKPVFPIVGIGASAGGLEAMEEFLTNMPTDTGIAFVVVTHLHPGHISLLPELLGKKTAMPVVEAADGLKVEPNHVYVGPSGGHLAILNRTLHRMETGDATSPKLPIDYFFRSLAEDQQEQAICIVLSGTGTDGTLGLKAIKGASGMAMVEQPQSAKYAGMPSSAIATGQADYILAPAAMPKQLVAYAQGAYLQGAAVAAELPTVPPEPMQKIFVLLRGRTGHDFSSYKPNTLRRRIERRMNVHQIEKPNAYVRLLQENPHEIDILFKELLISVTSFFRDPDAWDSLAESIKQLMSSRADDYSLRAWLPGCATGEEVFSLAITLRECMEQNKRHPGVQIFGTDLDLQAIETARAGQYAAGIAVDVSPQRLDRYFTRDDSTFRIRKEIREMTVFAQQNVIKDPPFTKLDLLVCRNLLIYLNADLQKKLLPIFHYALKPGGLLFLGSSETIGSFTDLFEPLDKHWRIFRRKECATAMRALPEMPAQPLTRGGDQTPATVSAPTVREPHISNVLERLLLGRFAPASVVVNDRGDIIYIHGRTGAYLELSEGRPRSNVLEMAREGLQIDLAAALRQCATKGKEVVREDIRVKSNGDSVQIDLSVARLDNPETVRGLLLVTFRPSSRAAPVKAKRQRTKPRDDDRIEQLERELQHMRESHQTTLEELETSNEELTSSNEELQSTNEELQSSNEELETSKEEMQSLNEELTTVNVELESKMDDLSQSNDDMQNLLNSTDIATVFLDNELNIKRFTEQATELVMLRPTDVGRPISDLASNLEYNELTTDCVQVLKTLVFREREVGTKDGGAYLMRIMPYRTSENVIDGVVITFINLRQVKEVEKTLHGLFESIVTTVRHPLLVLDKEHRVVMANRSFCATFRVRPTQIVGALIAKSGEGEWNIPELGELLESILPQNSAFENFEVDHEFPNVGRKVLLLNARRLEREQGLPGMILLAMEDVTEKRIT